MSVWESAYVSAKKGIRSPIVGVTGSFEHPMGAVNWTPLLYKRGKFLLSQYPPLISSVSENKINEC